MTDPRTRTVIVTLPRCARADWLTVAQILQWKGFAAGIPLSQFLVLGNWLTRRNTRDLFDPTPRQGAALCAAGGPISRLDLALMTNVARNRAAIRWQTWHALIARTGPEARPWEHFQALHEKDPDAMPLTLARAKFEAQPRVLAMLAYNSYPGALHHLDPYRLDEYQAGEAIYTALHWPHTITGDALITPEGRLLQPASTSVADRLRYLADAGRVVYSLHPYQFLVATKAATAPEPD